MATEATRRTESMATAGREAAGATVVYSRSNARPPGRMCRSYRVGFSNWITSAHVRLRFFLESNDLFAYPSALE